MLLCWSSLDCLSVSVCLIVLLVVSLPCCLSSCSCVRWYAMWLLVCLSYCESLSVHLSCYLTVRLSLCFLTWPSVVFTFLFWKLSVLPSSFLAYSLSLPGCPTVCLPFKIKLLSSSPLDLLPVFFSKQQSVCLTACLIHISVSLGWMLNTDDMRVCTHTHAHTHVQEGFLKVNIVLADTEYYSFIPNSKGKISNFKGWSCSAG